MLLLSLSHKSSCSKMVFKLLLIFSVFVQNGLGRKYTPDWASLDSRPLPLWFDEAKIGIFVNFGPYAVPGIGNEWFWMNWHQNHSNVVEFMAENYPPNFTYQDFGPLLTMEFFNASWFADVISDSGAKYLVFSSKHHDGFTNFNSSYTFGWNSMSVGPKRNIIKELKDAFMSRYPDFHFGLYYSLFEWFNPLYLKDKVNKMKTREFVMNKMLPEMKELAELVSPDVWWSDGDWEALPEYFRSKDFLAWLFNESPSKENVVVNDRWGSNTRLKHGSFFSGPDQWQPGYLIPHKWESAITVDKLSWGIRRNIKIEEVLSPEELISTLAATVSCGGNLLVNIGPTKEGTIIPVFEERLRQMGLWLKANGEAIYKTTPWKYQNDTFAQSPQVWYTTKKNITVYAIMLGWPNLDEILTLGSVKADSGTKIEILGYQSGPLQFKQEENGLSIKLPPFFKVIKGCPVCQWASVLKMTNVRPKTSEHENLVDGLFNDIEIVLE